MTSSQYRICYSLIAVSAALALALGCGRNGSNYVPLDDDASFLTPTTDVALHVPEAQGEEASTPQVTDAHEDASQAQPTPTDAPQGVPRFDAKGVALDLRDCAGFSALSHAQRAQLKNVKVLRASGVIDQQTLQTLADMPALVELLWQDAVITSPEQLGQETTAAFTTALARSGVKKVRFTGLKVNGSDASFPKFLLDALAQAPKLSDLDLSGSCIVDADLQGIDWSNQFAALTRLNLYDTQVSDATVRALAPLQSRLTWLNLDQTQISVASATELSKFSNLTFLHVGRTSLDDSSVEELAKLTNLEKIHVTRTKITVEGADALRKALPKCQVVSVPEN